MVTTRRLTRPSARPALRVLIVEDSAAVRSRLRCLVSEVKGLEVVSEAAGVTEALVAIADTAPDAIVLDLRLQDGSGLDLLELLRRSGRMPRVVVLTNSADAEVRTAALKAGAFILLDKSTEFDQVAGALKGRRSAAGGRP